MWYIYDNKGEIRAEVHELEYEGIDGGARTVTCSINSPIPIKWNVTDSLNYRGETFYLRHIPSEKKQARVGTREEAFVYNDIAFYSAIDELTSCDFLDVVKEDNSLHYSALPNFSFYCETIYDIADRLQANLDRLYTGSKKWTIQVSTDITAKVDIKPQALSFSSEKCSQVLERIYNDLGVTYEHSNRTIVFGAKPIMMPYEFKYGKGKGLKSIEQSGADGNALVTRARVYGSTRNLPNRYYNKLYKNSKTGAVMYFKTDEDKPKDFETYWKPLISETMYVPNLMLPMFRENGKDAYIDATDAIAKYGLREGTKFFDSNNGEDEEVYPTIENMTADRLEELGYTPELHDGDNGKLDELLYVDDVPFSGVMPEGGNLPASEAHFVVYLKDIGFDINDYLVGTPKISFRSGALAGREFDIVKCEQTALINKTYKLTCKRVEDTSIQLIFPYKDYKPSAGDKFVLLEIDMPEIYIKVAELRLKEEGEKWLGLNSNPIFTYNPEIDAVNVLRNPQIAENLKEGRTFIFADEDLGISKAIRISNLKIKDNGFAPEYEITLSDKHTVSLAEKVTQSVVNMIGSNNASTENIKALIDAYGNNLFLNKKKRDTADQVIRFTLGLEVGENKATINANGDAEVEKLTSRNEIKSQEVISNNIHTTDFAQGALLGTGGGYYTLNGLTYAEFDYLTARKGATFAELIIQEYRSIGGALVISQANGEIERIYDYGNGYNIWLKDDDRVDSLFANKDLVRCQYWDKTKNELVYYWTPVSVSEDLQGRYVLTIYKKDMNGVVPQVGDKLVHMGNTTDTSRQGCILLTTENSLPRMAILDGINSPTLSNSNYKGIYGSLDGFTDPYTNKSLSGYGMWGENVYLHGDLVVSSTKTTISSELANLNNALTLTKSLIDEDIREINNRLDGVVTNWFGDDVPRLDNYPAEQWITEQEKMNHIGDTYTNTETTGDNAGRSWRFIQENGEYKWIQIADSDAIKALEWAAKAQSTADGKRRVFVNTPTTPYDEGDLWIKQEGEKTTLYYSIVDKAEGQLFAKSDWFIGATDDTAIKDLQIGGTNLLVGTNQGVNNWSFSSSISTYTTKEISYNGASGVQIIKNNPMESAEWEIIKYPLRPELIKKDKKYHLTFDFMQSAENDTELGFSVSLNNTNGNNPLTNAVSLKSKNIGGIWQHFDVEFTAIANGNKNDGRIVYFNIQRSTNEWKDFAIANLKLEEGNKATTWSPSPEDAQDEYDHLAELANNAQITADNAQSLADEAKSNAYLAQSSANAAKERLDAWAEDGVISPNEKQGLKDELTRIEGDYKDIIDRFDRASLDSPSGYIEAYNAYTDMLSYLINESAISGKETTDIPEDFAEIQENYYQQKVNAYYDLYDSSLTSAENAQSTADTIAQTTATLTQDIININNRLDGIVENWFYKGYPTPQNAPAIEWTNAQEKYNHIGDTFTSIDENGDYAGKSWRWIGVTAEPSFEIDFTTGSINGVTYYFYWQTIADSDAIKALEWAAKAQSTADGKRRVFVAQPKPAYDEGDLWVKTENGVTTIYYCVTSKADGNVFDGNDWELASTDDSALQAFINGNFKEKISNLQTQIDGKAETWYQESDPSKSWITDGLKELHTGDMWYKTTTNTTYRWNGSSWDEQNIPKSVFDTIDGKAQIFVSTPTPPYYIGDLWVQGEDGDIMRCMTSRVDGMYNPNDWKKASKYTDDTELNAYKVEVGKEFQVTDGKFESMQYEIDGATSARNLLLKAYEPIENKNYLIGSYNLGNAKPKVGDDVTLSFIANVTDDRIKNFRVFNSGGVMPIQNKIQINEYGKDVKVVTTFTWNINANDGNTHINIYQTDADLKSVAGLIGNTKISKIKLEFGTVATDWSIAPEETDYYYESRIKQTAESIELKVKNGLAETGIDIENKKITVTADNFTIKNNNDKIVASADKFGNWSTNTLITLNDDGTKAITINEEGNRILTHYYPYTNQRQLEEGWNGTSLFRYFDENGVMLWQIGGAKGFMNADYVEWTAVGLYKTGFNFGVEHFESNKKRFTSIGDVELSAYYQHNVINATPKMYETQSTNNPLNGWFTNQTSWQPFDSYPEGFEVRIWKRQFIHYTNGVEDWRHQLKWDMDENEVTIV